LRTMQEQFSFLYLNELKRQMAESGRPSPDFADLDLIKPDTVAFDLCTLYYVCFKEIEIRIWVFKYMVDSHHPQLEQFLFNYSTAINRLFNSMKYIRKMATKKRLSVPSKGSMVLIGLAEDIREGLKMLKLRWVPDIDMPYVQCGILRHAGLRKAVTSRPIEHIYANKTLQPQEKVDSDSAPSVALPTFEITTTSKVKPVCNHRMYRLVDEELAGKVGTVDVDLYLLHLFLYQEYNIRVWNWLTCKPEAFESLVVPGGETVEYFTDRVELITDRLIVLRLILPPDFPSDEHERYKEIMRDVVDLLQKHRMRPLPFCTVPLISLPRQYFPKVLKELMTCWWQPTDACVETDESELEIDLGSNRQEEKSEQEESRTRVDTPVTVVTILSPSPKPEVTETTEAPEIGASSSTPDEPGVSGLNNCLMPPGMVLEDKGVDPNKVYCIFLLHAAMSEFALRTATIFDFGQAPPAPPQWTAEEDAGSSPQESSPILKSLLGKIDKLKRWNEQYNSQLPPGLGPPGLDHLSSNRDMGNQCFTDLIACLRYYLTVNTITEENVEEIRALETKLVTLIKADPVPSNYHKGVTYAYAAKRVLTRELSQVMAFPESYIEVAKPDEVKMPRRKPERQRKTLARRRAEMNANYGLDLIPLLVNQPANKRAIGTRYEAPCTVTTAMRYSPLACELLDYCMDAVKKFEGTPLTRIIRHDPPIEQDIIRLMKDLVTNFRLGYRPIESEVRRISKLMEVILNASLKPTRQPYASGELLPVFSITFLPRGFVDSSRSFPELGASYRFMQHRLIKGLMQRLYEKYPIIATMVDQMLGQTSPNPKILQAERRVFWYALTISAIETSGMRARLGKDFEGIEYRVNANLKPTQTIDIDARQPEGTTYLQWIEAPFLLPQAIKLLCEGPGETFENERGRKFLHLGAQLLTVLNGWTSEPDTPSTLGRLPGGPHVIYVELISVPSKRGPLQPFILRTEDSDKNAAKARLADKMFDLIWKRYPEFGHYLARTSVHLDDANIEQETAGKEPVNIFRLRLTDLRCDLKRDYNAPDDDDRDLVFSVPCRPEAMAAPHDPSLLSVGLLTTLVQQKRTGDREFDDKAFLEQKEALLLALNRGKDSSQINIDPDNIAWVELTCTAKQGLVESTDFHVYYRLYSLGTISFMRNKMTQDLRQFAPGLFSDSGEDSIWRMGRKGKKWNPKTMVPWSSFRIRLIDLENGDPTNLNDPERYVYTCPWYNNPQEREAESERVCDLHDRSPPHDMVLVMKYLISLTDRKMTLLEYAEKTSFLRAYFEDTLNPDLPLAAMDPQPAGAQQKTLGSS
jgi:hypothetical protein